MHSVLADLHKRYFTYDQALKATETWSERTKTMPSFRKLVSTQSKFELAIRKHWQYQKEHTDQFVNWSTYALLVPKKAAEITVNNEDGSSYVSAIDSAAFVNEKALMQAILTEYILTSTGLGIADANEIYTDSGLSVTSSEVVRAVTDRTATLVQDITKTTRADIQQSIATSIKLRETVEEASYRVGETIGSSYRAEMIARTETRNSYIDGQQQVATQIGYTKQKWDPSADPCPLCEENADAGWISTDDDFPNGDDPHPNCLCGAIIYGMGSPDDGND